MSDNCPSNMEEKLYNFFMNTLMKSDIIVDKPLKTYTTLLRLQQDFQEGRYFQTMMRLSCLIESILYELLLLKLPTPPHKLLVKEVRKMQEISLGILIDWASGGSIPRERIKIICYPTNLNPPIINEKEKEILHNLREIRNDIAHTSFLTYDENLKKEVIKKIIDDVEPIHHKIIEEIIKITDEKLTNISQ